jgi:hypothetical protein
VSQPLVTRFFWGWLPDGSSPLLHVGSDKSEADTHRRFLRGCIFGRGCESRRLHQLPSTRMGLRALRSGGLHYFSAAARLVSVPAPRARSPHRVPPSPGACRAVLHQSAGRASPERHRPRASVSRIGPTRVTARWAAVRIALSLVARGLGLIGGSIINGHLLLFLICKYSFIYSAAPWRSR